jgi:hypothetical protein
VELSPFAGRPVQDKTGLIGVFDFELGWTPDQVESKSDSGPSFTTAIEEQLGLKLKSEKGQIEVLVLDHLEKPPFSRAASALRLWRSRPIVATAIVLPFRRYVAAASCFSRSPLISQLSQDEACPTYAIVTS